MAARGRTNYVYAPKGQENNALQQTGRSCHGSRVRVFRANPRPAAERGRWVAQAMHNVTECEELLDRLCFRRNAEDFCFGQQLNRQI
jgi:hypothetical protein